MSRAFVSYSRKDTAFTRKLTDALIAQNMELWIDWKNIPPTVDWKLQIQKGVEEADAFLFLISPDSVKSGECAEEIAHAINNNKRVITLLVRKVGTDDLPEKFKHINWIDFSTEDCFDESFQKLLEGINTDYEWLQFHSQLQGKALEWERHDKDSSLLLRGMELETVEAQLLVNASKEPEPTDVQREYVVESKTAKEAERKAREKQRRIITISSVVVAIAMLVLAVWAYGKKLEADEAKLEALRSQAAEKNAADFAEVKRQEAEQERNFAQIGELSALAVGKIDQDYNEALLFSVEAYHRATETGSNQESAKSALLATLQSRHGLKQILQGHNDWIRALAYTPDGNLLASSSWDNVTILWNTADPSNPTKLNEIKGDDVAINPDKDKPILATTSYDEQDGYVILLWSYDETGKVEQLGKLPGSRIIDFSPDGNLILVAYSDENNKPIIDLWDVSSPTEPGWLSTIPGEAAYIDGKGKFVGVQETNENNESSIVIWDISNPNAPVRSTSLKGNVAAFHPAKDIVAITDYQTSSVKLWDITDLSSPRELGRISGQSDSVRGITFNRDGNSIVLGSDEGKIYIWNSSDPENLPNRPFETLSGHTLSINFFAFNSSGNILASGSNDGSILLWDTTQMKSPIQVDNELTAMSSWDIATNGKFLVTSEYDEGNGSNSLVIWDTSDFANPVQIGTIDNFPDTYYFVRISPTGKTIVYCAVDQESGKDYTVIWDLSDPTNPVSVKTFEEYYSDVRFSPDGNILVFVDPNTASADSTLTAWDLSDPAQIKSLGTLHGYLADFGANNKQLALMVVDADGKYGIQLWDLSSWSGRKMIGEIKGFPKLIKTAGFSRDGKTLAVGSDDKTITIWNISDPAKPSRLAILNGHSDWINSVVFSPDDSTLASGSDDYNVILWDTKNLKEIKQLGTLKGHLNGVFSIAFSEDGLSLLSTDYSGTILLWDIDPISWMNKACHIVGSNFSEEKWNQLFPDIPYRETCENTYLDSTQPPQSVESVSGSNTTGLPLCTDQGTASCPLVTWNANENERDRFCIDSLSYTLYAFPEGTTLTPSDKDYTCTDEGIRGGFQMYTCYSLKNPNTTFQATMCNTSCQVAQSDQCGTGLGLDQSQSCCAPVSTDGCMDVTLEVGSCAQ